MKLLRTLIGRWSAVLSRNPAIRLLWYFGVFALFFHLSGLRLLNAGGDTLIGLILSSLLAAVIISAVHVYLFSTRSSQQ
jgi:hypothetical protein